MIVFNSLHCLIDNFITVYIEQNAVPSIILPAMNHYTSLSMFTLYYLPAECCFNDLQTKT